ncbi:hypothetical protein ACQP3J_30370, partial [Escherichia coli]
STFVILVPVLAMAMLSNCQAAGCLAAFAAQPSDRSASVVVAAVLSPRLLASCFLLSLHL